MNLLDILYNFFGDKVKPLRLRWKFIIIIATATLLFLIPKCYKAINERIKLNRIYLRFSEWNISLNKSYQMISAPLDIKKDEPIVLRFSLIQNNKDIPEITTIFIDFPSDAEVKPIPYEGWTWVRTNAPKNQYLLNCSSQSYASGAEWNLPPLNATFRETDLLGFKYYIIGNMMGRIERAFIIDSREEQEDSRGLLFRFSPEPEPETMATPDVARPQWSSPQAIE